MYVVGSLQLCVIPEFAICGQRLSWAACLCLGACGGTFIRLVWIAFLTRPLFSPDVSSPWLTHDWSDVRWEFDLRQAVGAAASSLVSRLSAVLLLSVFYSHSPRADCAPHQQDTCSCKQCENLVAPLSGGAALEEAAAWEAQQMEAARHAKELQSQYWGRQRQQRARRDWRRLSG
ncbi:hypothetical protein EMIHUDRAFT_230282 [Emiliania huxleyi CCMP1516]|uniref:Uncharacterized protein n=2 Tax=Emiliania huxleyi TaxID=2903 RepID=A0A0D3KAV5_EMIH1|nr:hypothetical protein EMIHUDRAFT_230282 [Emiliania huxleyi CCMP1516]EOD32890.1 hypothetical protein EMIHUDRAFT_230282 [Emiliania huxleyi CCMP1516]|eukprot:XP_005785319.1 hypothetical protein EMIHUDRAFT_230282 [Emiliania huxleyi CCMP1516]